MRRATEDEPWQGARWLASTADGQVVGATKYQARDLAHRIGAKAIEVALEGRKEGGTSGRARVGQPATNRPDSWRIVPDSSSA